MIDNVIQYLFYVDGVLVSDAVVAVAYIAVAVIVFLILSSFMLYWDPADVFMAMGLSVAVGMCWGPILVLGVVYIFPWMGAKLLHARDRWNG